jgi:Tfp pilus assembly protein FimT
MHKLDELSSLARFMHSLSPQPPSSLGFTLLENLTIVAIVGTMAASAAPSFLAFHQRQRLNQAADTLVNGLREAQLKAIERGSRCAIGLEANHLDDLHNCLVGGDRSWASDITLTSAGLDRSIEYGIKGNVVDNRTLILRLRQGRFTPRCLVISAPLGVLRQGQYQEATQTCQNL